MPHNKRKHEMNKNEHTISRNICNLQNTSPIISGFVESVSLDKDTESYLRKEMSLQVQVVTNHWIQQ